MVMGLEYEFKEIFQKVEQKRQINKKIQEVQLSEMIRILEK